MRIAIIMAGPYRGNKSIVENQLNMIGSYDTYVSCLEHYREDWINSGWNIKKLFTTPNINFKETNWAKYRDDGAGQAGFWQFWNLRNVIKSIPNNYDFYIKTRCDLEFTECNLDISNLQSNTIYSSNHNFHQDYWHREHLINDQFYIGDYNSMLVVSDVVMEFYTKDRHGKNDAGPYFGSNEAALRMFLNENNISVNELTGIKYTKNHNGVTEPSGCTGFQLETI